MWIRQLHVPHRSSLKQLSLILYERGCFTLDEPKMNVSRLLSQQRRDLAFDSANFNFDLVSLRLVRNGADVEYSLRLWREV